MEAQASIRAISAIGGRAALTMIAEILSRRPPEWHLEALVNNAWRFFKPDEYLAEILIPFWPVEYELNVSDPVLLAALFQFSELRRVRCQLGNFNAAENDIRSLALNRQLRGVTLEGCSPGLDLSPLRQLPLLEQLGLMCDSSAPGLSPISDSQKLTSLTLHCQVAKDSLHPLAGFCALLDLELHGCHDVRNIGNLELPDSIRNLKLAGFGGINALSGVERWGNLKSLELLEFSGLADLGPIAELASLEALGIGVVRMSEVSLAPLADLPRLREIVLMGDNVFDLSGLWNRRLGATVHVPMGAKLIGRDKLGPGISVVEFTAPPRVHAPFRERGGP
jgi:hypothetical protein